MKKLQVTVIGIIIAICLGLFVKQALDEKEDRRQAELANPAWEKALKKQQERETFHYLPDTASQPTAKDVKYYSTFKVGDTIFSKSFDYSIVILQVEKNLMIPYQELTLSEEEKYVGLQIMCINTTDKQVKYNLAGFILSDQEGYNYEIALLPMKKPAINYGRLAAGGKAKGWLTFKTLKSAKKLTLHIGGKLTVELQ